MANDEAATAEDLLRRAIARGREGDEAGALADAERAASLKPDLAPAWRAIGSLRYRRRDFDGARRALEQAVAAAPAESGYRMNLAELHREAGDTAAARAHLAEARRLLAPDAPAAQLNRLAAAFLDAADRHQAFELAVLSLQREDTPVGRKLFTETVRVQPLPLAADARALLRRAIAEPWARPITLAPIAVKAVLGSPAFKPLVDRAWGWPAPGSAPAELLAGLDALAGEPLLLEALTSAPAGEIAVEAFLTAARAALLGDAVAGASAEARIAFYVALARHCFVNEYAFVVTPAEEMAVAALAAALTSGGPSSLPALLAVAAYRPLSALPGADALLEMDWPDGVAALLTQQVAEPRREAELVAEIPRLTPISEGMSAHMREQYEENPYPRWMKTQPVEHADPIDRMLRQALPHVRIDPVPNAEAPEVLIAACGTGQQSVEAAGRYRNGRILAVDLSLRSLAYARRKTEEMGVGVLSYGQADIVRLAELNRTFDVIECAGVLHHLDDPIAGARTLAGMLRPGGVMLLALYSKLARAPLQAAKRLIVERGWKPTPDHIRAFRAEVMAAPEGSALRQPATFGNFFTVSGCRDLVFNVGEDEFTVPRIEEMVREAGLVFLGFTTRPETLLAYRRDFPDDPSATSFANWAEFEARHPRTFRGMYTWWVQKPL